MKGTGERIRRLMKARGMKQYELARELGVAEPTVWRYINDEREVNTKVICKMADVLECSVDYILGHHTKTSGNIANNYQEEALKFASPISSSTDFNLMLQGVMGLNGEAGEAIDIVKKHVFHGHDLDKEHLAKELGDCMWYIATAAVSIGYSLEEIMQMNIDKLTARYGEKFSTERSLHRKEGDI